MFVMAKKNIKELFASTLKGKTASVRWVSSIIVVLNAELTRLIAAQANKKGSEKRISPTKVPFLLVETHKHSTSSAALTVHTETSQLYTFQRSMQAYRNINPWYLKAQVIPQQSTQDAANLPLQTCDKNQ